MKHADRRGERGAELIEFAFSLPVLLLVFAGIIDFGLLFQRYEVVTNAAREGARIASLPGYSSADVTARVNAYITNGISKTATATTTVTPVSIAVATGPAVQANQVEVQHTSAFIVIGPIASLFKGGGTFGTITLTGRATMRVEVPSS